MSNVTSAISQHRTRAIFDAIALGHTAWGLLAYGDQVRPILSGVPGSVGDGLFDKAGSRDERAAAFWFLFAGPMLSLLGRAYDAAEQADDPARLRATARGIAVLSAAGWAVIPRSGFPAGLGLGLWLMRRARTQPDGASRCADRGKTPT